MRILEDRNYRIRVVENMKNKGEFGVLLGKAALIADEKNLRKLVFTFPEYFIEGHGLRLVYERNDNLLNGFGEKG